jgi:type II secretory pathway pseudopilin PulG
MIIIETLLSILIISIIAMTFSTVTQQFSKTISLLTVKKHSLSEGLNTIEAAKTGQLSPSLNITTISPTLTKYSVTISPHQTLDYIQ